MSHVLLAGSAVALVLLAIHSWTTRGRAVTLAFFGLGLAYAILREGAVTLIMQSLTGVPGIKPYIPQDGFLPEVGRAHLQVAVGWVFAMYLAWTISELILRRMRGDFHSRVFMIAGLSALVVEALCYCMETTAVAAGWWYWEVPTRSALFGNVNTSAMEGWFTVVPDFLLPFLVIACSEARSRWKWLWALAFPLHVGGHMMCRWFPPFLAVYYVLELLVLVPMMTSPLRMARGGVRPAAAPGSREPSAFLPAAALAIFFGVVAAADFAGRGGSVALWTAAPMALLCLLAWKRAPVPAVAALSLAAAAAGWAFIGPRALWALAPTAAFAFLDLFGRLREPLALRLVPAAAVVALATFSIVLTNLDHARMSGYLDAWAEGDRLHFGGKPAEAASAYARADRLRPHRVIYFYAAAKRMTSVPTGDVRASAVIFDYRLAHVTREFEEMVRRDGEFYPIRRDLALFYLLEGRFADAVRHYREIHAVRPADASAASLFAWLLLRHGETDPAGRVLERLAARRTPPVEALVNLGVLRFHERRDDEARRLWERALERNPAGLARRHLERMRDPSADRAIDVRYLARDRDAAGLAGWVNDFALGAPGKTESERVRLLIEAAQMDPERLEPQANLAQRYLEREGSLYDPARAVWHARAAVDIARNSRAHTDAERGRALLLLGRALLADGKPDDARRALDEGRALLPPAATGP